MPLQETHRSLHAASTSKGNVVQFLTALLSWPAALHQLEVKGDVLAEADRVHDRLGSNGIEGYAVTAILRSEHRLGHADLRRHGELKAEELADLKGYR